MSLGGHSRATEHGLSRIESFLGQKLAPKAPCGRAPSFGGHVGGRGGPVLARRGQRARASGVALSPRGRCPAAQLLSRPAAQLPGRHVLGPNASPRHHHPRPRTIEHLFCGQPASGGGQPRVAVWTAGRRVWTTGQPAWSDCPSLAAGRSAAPSHAWHNMLRSDRAPTTTSCVFRLDPASATAYSLKVAPTPDDHSEPVRTVILEATELGRRRPAAERSDGRSRSYVSPPSRDRETVKRTEPPPAAAHPPGTRVASLPAGVPIRAAG